MVVEYDKDAFEELESWEEHLPKNHTEQMKWIEKHQPYGDGMQYDDPFNRGTK